MDQQTTNGTKKEEIKATFFHLVVRLITLDAMFPGGAKAFLDKFEGARTNSDLAIWCVMGSQGIEPMVNELLANKLSEDDFFVGVWDGMSIGPPGPEEIVTLRSWLQGRIVGANLWISHLA